MHPKIKGIISKSSIRFSETGKLLFNSIVDIEDLVKLVVRECSEIALREDHDPAECILTSFGLKKGEVVNVYELTVPNVKDVVAKINSGS